MPRFLVLISVFLFCAFAKRITAQSMDTTSLYAQPATETAQAADSVSYSNSVPFDTDEEDEESYEDNEPDTNVQRYIAKKDWQKIKEDKEFVYTKEVLKKAKPTPKPPDLSWLRFFSSAFFRFLLYALAILFIVFIVYNILKNSDFTYFRKKKLAEDEPYESFDEVEHISDWDKAIKEALDAKDYRLATRLLYKQTLQSLNERNIIQYEKQKTNWEYVNKLAASPLYKPFLNLTNYFDYIWYGSFSINAEQFERIRAEFVHFNKEARA